jgi:transcriptional regulator with XRE-family HTH domain
MPRNIGVSSDNCNGKIRGSGKTPTTTTLPLAEAATPDTAGCVVQRKRPTWDFGRKVALLLADRQANGLEPTSGVELALRVGCDSGTVYGWINDGARPRSDRGRKVAQVLGVPYEWLTDDQASYPPRDNATSLAAALSLLPDAERQDLAKILRDPVERRAWLAHWRARRGQP